MWKRAFSTILLWRESQNATFHLRLDHLLPQDDGRCSSQARRAYQSLVLFEETNNFLGRIDDGCGIEDVSFRKSSERSRGAMPNYQNLTGWPPGDGAEDGLGLVCL